MPDRPNKIDVGIVLGRAGVGFDEDSPEQVEAWLRTFLPDEVVDRGVQLLIRAGFEIMGRSKCTLSLRATPELFERYFSSKVVCTRVSGTRGGPGTLVCRIADGVFAVPDQVKDLVGTVTIQPASRPLAGVRATPPSVPGVFFLDVMNDVPRLLNAPAVHAAGITGAGVRLTMIDTGFEHSHPFFVANGFRSEVLLAGNARSKGTDSSGHGTGCSANVFAIAPGVDFTGVKLGDDVDGVEGSASLLAGFQRALGFDPAHRESRTGRDARPLPQIISVSVSCGEMPGTPPWHSLPEELTPLEACVREAVLASGIAVVAAGGNQGERAFPGQMKRVIAVGGVFKPKDGPLRVSEFASAFTSRVYGGREVPDCCGLCGNGEHADYIMLPVPSGSDHDVDFGVFDGTTKHDGWARFSGTSAAAPQVAAVCALMLEKNPGLTPQQLKSRLEASAVDVQHGKAAGMDGDVGLAAGVGPDRATGAGLVDAKAAVDLA